MTSSTHVGASTAQQASSVRVRTTSTDERDPAVAVAALVAELGTEADLYLVFVATPYPLDDLAVELCRAWQDRVIGCTSAGNLGAKGYHEGALTAIALSGGGLRAQTVAIEPLDQLAAGLRRAEPALRELCQQADPEHTVALMLVDGLSLQEEHVAASLGTILGDIPLIGGSAGDDLSFRATAVLSGGRFSSNAATTTVITSRAPLRVFRIQHFEPGEKVLVITDADPAVRTVREINGMPAVEAYADALGLAPEQLDTGVFSAHPVIMRAGGSSWVRSVSRALPDGGLAFFAAVDAGAVLRIARTLDPVDTLTSQLDVLNAELGTISGMIAFDCILRRIEFQDAGLLPAIEPLLQGVGAAGFSTYGEQFGDFHMNQTMVGVAFGGPPVPTGDAP